MKAFYLKKYGKPEEQLIEIETEIPKPKPNQVLIKIKATTINDYDWCISTGSPFSYRLFFGFIKPKKKLRIPGMELSGVIEELGTQVKNFKIGDAVYGDISDAGFGSFAEYVCIEERVLTKKPDYISFEEAASIPHAATLALQGLKDVGKINKGQKILINGGGGGVGFFGLQIAKLYDCNVTGVDTGEKLNLMIEQGFDKVLDYKKTDFTQESEIYDIILDCKTNRSLYKFLKVLKPNGKYVSIGGKSGKLLQMLYMKPLLKVFSKKRLDMVMLKANQDLDVIHHLYKDNKLKCTIDGPYPFQKIPWAIQRFGDGLHYGKIVISVHKISS